MPIPKTMITNRGDGIFLVWNNGVCYKMATFYETERILWLKAIQMASYDNIKEQLVALKEKLNRIRPTIDVVNYRLQKGIVTDMNEVPLCELALSCDNLLCDVYGRAPSSIIVIYVKLSKGLSLRYGSTEIVETCSNPTFSKTILFRASDGLTGDAMVRIVVYNVKERVSGTLVPMGFTTMQLTTIQEAQRMRISLLDRENKTVGFVTINGWSLEPSYVGTSPSHTNDWNSIDIPQKMLCHRRSQSLPPKLGLKLKFPSYGTLLKQNFVNSCQVTYRFHSGLGGDITVHEIMAEPKLCYLMPTQLLEIYIQREKELLEELLSVGEMCGQWQAKQLELVNIHVSILKRYCHAKHCMQQMDDSYYKGSSKKDDVSLDFAPVNLHLQRMWVHNDTLNKTGFHDVMTVGAFSAHTYKAEKTGGLIRLLQDVKDVNNAKVALNTATANKIQAEYENVLAVKQLRDDIVIGMDKVFTLLQNNQGGINSTLEEIKIKVRSIMALWDPIAVEESLAFIGWTKATCNDDSNYQISSTIKRLTEQLSLFTPRPDSDTYYASSSSSSKDTSPTGEIPSLSSSVPNICPNWSKNYKETFKEITEGTELEFHNDYFKEERNSLNHSFRSVRSVKMNNRPSLMFDSNKLRHGSLTLDFRSSTSLGQVSYRSLTNNLGCNDKKQSLEVGRDSLPVVNKGQCDPMVREQNKIYFRSIGWTIEDAIRSFEVTAINIVKSPDRSDDLDCLKVFNDDVKSSLDSLLRWLRVSHASLRLRCESPQWTRIYATLQTRRDICFSQALTTLASGLLCWLCSVPSEVVVKVLSSDLGPLCGFEGLLSLHSTEVPMWGDMVVAIEDMQTVLFTLVKVGHSSTTVPQVSGSRNAITVHIPVSDSLYAKFSSKAHLTFSVVAVFFNIGINEKATLAEALGESTPQYHSNSDNLDRLTKYYHKYNKVFPTDHIASIRASSRAKPLEEVMENLRIAVHKKVPKNVEVLHLAALATRLMNGIRFTSCKSAKDRTGMSVTLEQCTILSSEYHLAEHELSKALSIMRSEGCRRENTYKNIGVKKYAFTKKQVSSLPALYRPPPGTYGSSDT